MKTAMQELIEDLSNNMVISIFERLERKGIFIKALEKEKDQIEDAFDYGYYCASNGTSAEITLDGKMHYNQTYNQNK